MFVNMIEIDKQLNVMKKLNRQFYTILLCLNKAQGRDKLVSIVRINGAYYTKGAKLE